MRPERVTFDEWLAFSDAEKQRFRSAYPMRSDQYSAMDCYDLLTADDVKKCLSAARMAAVASSRFDVCGAFEDVLSATLRRRRAASQKQYADSLRDPDLEETGVQAFDATDPEELIDTVLDLGRRLVEVEKRSATMLVLSTEAMVDLEQRIAKLEVDRKSPGVDPELEKAFDTLLDTLHLR